MKTFEPTKGFVIPNLIMGCMRIAQVEKHALERLIIGAIENGVTYFDHADFYGDGASEERFSEFTQLHPDLRESIQIQSKFGICKGYYNSSYEHIIFSANNSLKKLKIDYLDALLIHRPDVLVEPEEVARAFEELSTSGKVRHFGVSNHTPSQIEVLKQAVGQKLIINQLQLGIMHTGMIDQGINVNTKFEGSMDRDGAVLDYCKINNLIIQAWSPMQFGFIEGAFIDNPNYPTINNAMEDVAQKYGITKTALAVAWIARIPAMIQIVSGSTKLNRIKEMCIGANTRIEREDWYKIYKAAGNNLP
jgi:predicted oxidoreductase